MLDIYGKMQVLGLHCDKARNYGIHTVIRLLKNLATKVFHHAKIFLCCKNGRARRQSVSNIHGSLDTILRPDIGDEVENWKGLRMSDTGHNFSFVMLALWIKYWSVIIGFFVVVYIMRL